MISLRWSKSGVLFASSCIVLSLAATTAGCARARLMTDQELQEMFEEIGEGQRGLSEEAVLAAERLAVHYVLLTGKADEVLGWPYQYAMDVLGTPEGVNTLLTRLKPGNTLGNWVYMQMLVEILLLTPGHGYQSYRRGMQVRFYEYVMGGHSRESELFIDLSGDKASQEKAIRLFKARAASYLAEKYSR